MSDLSDLIAAYPDLSAEDRARVDAQIGEHPRLAEAYAQARRLAAALDALQRPASDLDRAHEAIGQRFRGEPVTDAEMRERLEALDQDAADPIRQFEQLSGRPFDGRLTLPASGGDSASPPLALVDLKMAAPSRRSTWLPRLAAAATVVLVAYGALFGVSAASVSERAQVASLEEVAPVSLPALRGASAPATDRVRDALAAVRDARRSTLGLFPHYDTDALTAAAAELAAVAAEAPPQSWVSQEARLAQGRVLLYLERDIEAARVLGTLLDDGSYRSGAARRLLDYIRANG